jgi:hypothetical protein
MTFGNNHIYSRCVARVSTKAKPRIASDKTQESLSMVEFAAPSLGTGLISILIGFLVVFIIYLLIIGFVLWLAGEIVVGRRVTFVEALGIAAVGTFLVGASITFLPGLIGLLVGLLVFLLLVKHYFKTGWLGAIGVSIMAIVVGIVLIFILGALALGALFVLPKIPGL